MSGVATIPTSTAPESEARHLSGIRKLTLGEIATGVVIGQASKFFAFVVCATGPVAGLARVVPSQFDGWTGSMPSIVVFNVVVPLPLAGNDGGEFTSRMLNFALLSLSFGQADIVGTRKSRLRHRYTGGRSMSDFGRLIGAGFTLLFSLALPNRLGPFSTRNSLALGAAGTSIALILDVRLAQAADLSDAALDHNSRGNVRRARRYVL